MKYGQIVHFVEIPVTIDYHIEPEDESFPRMFGPHPVVDNINYADRDTIYELIGKEADVIKQACLDDAKE